jgi:hypothetical protein
MSLLGFQLTTKIICRRKMKGPDSILPSYMTVKKIIIYKIKKDKRLEMPHLKLKCSY